MNRLMLSAALGALVLGLAACEREGPMERAGEETDEAVDTFKQGGESAGDKIDDTMDEMREGAHETQEEVQDQVQQ